MKGFRLWIPVASALCAPAMTAQGLPNDAPHAARATINPIRLRFDNTDVSDVLQALSLKTRANIVFSAQIKHPISINVAASSTEEALRYITAAAGLSYRFAGHTYVVAPVNDLRQALEPFGDHVRINLNTLTPDSAVKLLEGALPFLTARPAGNQVLVIGATEDVAQARALLGDQDKPQGNDPATTDVIVIQHIPASQVATTLRTMYPALRAEAVGPADKPGGAVGIAGPKSQLASAKDAILRMDVPAGANELARTYQIYTIKYGSAPNLKTFLTEAAPNVTVLVGPENYAPSTPNFHPLSSASFGSVSSSSQSSSSSSGGAAGASGGASGGSASGGMTSSSSGGTDVDPPGCHATTLVLGGAPADVDAALKLLEQVDIAPQQVMVEVKVVDTSPERAEQLGLQWNWSPLGIAEVPAGTQLGANGEPPTVSKNLGFGSFSRLPIGIQAILNAMTTRKEAKILADPRILVVDNMDANIFIGDTIRVQVSQASLTGTTVQVLEFPVGIILLVRPRVNADGKITMRVHPVVSTITGYSAGNIPQSSSREAETTVMVKDGETIVLGGLIRDEISKTVQEVPILSKIPIIGELFRNRSTDHTHSDVLIFITPHIVKG